MTPGAAASGDASLINASASERLATQAEELGDALGPFLLQHSRAIALGPPPPRMLRIEDFKWARLDQAGRAVQAALRRDYARFYDLAVALIGGVTETVRVGDGVVRELIEQTCGEVPKRRAPHRRCQ